MCDSSDATGNLKGEETVKPILWIGIGGFCGAITRFLIGSWLSGTFGTAVFPVATFVINITGSFLLGLLAGGASSLTPQVMSALTVGFLGSYTTFSTFSVETLRLIEQNQILPALFYATGSVAAGLIGAWAGGVLARILS
jgi:fluoride exporter